MSAFMQFEVFGKPEPQGSTRAFINRKTGASIITSTNPNMRGWRDLVASESRAQMAGLPPLDGPVEVEVVFWLPRPKSVKRDRPHVKPDVDKLARAILDGLTNVIYRDDAQVVRVTAEKRYVDDATPNPCAAITVRA